MFNFINNKGWLFRLKHNQKVFKIKKQKIKIILIKIITPRFSYAIFYSQNPTNINPITPFVFSTK